jgi:arylsulfatase A-like enzyme
MLNRRTFSGALSAGLLGGATAPLPNILWITAEDIGPHLGCYGDRYAVTPQLDRLAARSLRYLHCWSNAPVCAPARTAIISGVYPPSTGSEHMRSQTRMPAFMRMYPQFLREAGYYTTNNSKEDYNLVKPDGVWDDSSPRAHWRNRRRGQPFFAVFNFTSTHESQIRRRPHTLAHDPAGVRVPPYHPDTPEVRHDWAQYYDNLTTLDGQAAQVLAELETDGLAADTIVFFYGDHGSGMPRHKRCPYDSGLRVPLLVHIPDKYRRLAPKDYRAGGQTGRLVSFVDLAPTVLSLAGIRPPEWMQGHAFLGRYAARPQPYVYGFRGRMDERYDLVRSVRDQRYVYVRNYMPYLPYGQHLSYMFETPTTQVWKRLYDEGKLTPVQRRFWEARPPEELYDLERDPDEVENLADSPAHRAVRDRLRAAQQELARRIRDVGFLPEDEIHARAEGSTPYEMARDDRRYPFARVFAAAEQAASGEPIRDYASLFRDADSAVRYWGAMALLMRGGEVVRAEKELLVRALADPAPAVQIAAARALGQYADGDELERSLEVLVERADASRNPYYAAVQALNALDALDERARPVLARIRQLPDTSQDAARDPRTRDYTGRLLRKTLADLGAGKSPP